MNNDDHELLQNDKSLKCLRIEINSNNVVFLYYKIYPKEDSIRFPQIKSAIFFYFDSDHVDKHFIKTYISQVGPIDEIETGNYINRKGSKKKRKTVFFAIVKFIEEVVNPHSSVHKQTLFSDNFLFTDSSIVFLNIPMDGETPSGRLLRPQAMLQETLLRNYGKNRNNNIQ